MQLLAGETNKPALSQLEKNTSNMEVIHATILFASFAVFLFISQKYCSLLFNINER
jgi:hypothetical protein